MPSAPASAPMPASSAIEERDAFLAELDQMSPAARLLAARRGGFSRAERAIWARNFPEEVPTINGEVEWIALGLADLD